MHVPLFFYILGISVNGGAERRRRYHMLRKIRTLSLEKQLLISFLIVSVFLLLLSLSITLSFNLTRQRQEIDKNLSGIASYISSMDQVVSMLEAGYPDIAAVAELDSLYETFATVNVIAVYNAGGLRFYHTNRREAGETSLNGEEDAILNGSPPYITTGFGTRGTQRRAYHAIHNEEGTIIGFVMVSVFTDYITRQAQALLPAYALILLIMLFVSLLLSNAIVRLLRTSLMGHRPEELLELYREQDNVLNAIEDGLIASDRFGTVIFANQTALQILPPDTCAAGFFLADLFPQTALASVLRTGQASGRRSLSLYGRQLLVNEIPIQADGSVQGILTILNDRTEMESLFDELSGARAMLDTLRAFNHEFLNKLHVILGYLQTGETQKAIAFIINSNLVTSQAIRQTADSIRVSRICALVIGKMMHAAELGIRLLVTPDSRCLERDLLLPVDSFITIAGNLLENAIEELCGCQKEVKEITLGIYCREECNLVTCEDTGDGIDEELLAHIYEKGVSSKGENRGTGLFLIHNLVKEYHGTIEIETEAGLGTCFTLTFTDMTERN